MTLQTRASGIRQVSRRFSSCAKLADVRGQCNVTSRSNMHQAHSLPAWRAVLLSFFIALFAFVFPFLCWGALADPGHPHAHAHFVFAKPPLRNTQADAVFHAAHGHFHVEQSCGEPCDVAGQSQLDTLLVMLLLVVFFAWRYRQHLPAATIGVQTVLGAAMHTPLIATPPPRTG